MLKIRRAARSISFINKQSLTIFSPTMVPKDTKLIFPLYSRVMNECGVVLYVNAKNKPLPSLTNSFISFYGGPDNYRLLEKTAQPGDQGIAALANIATTARTTLLKLFGLNCLKLAMEAFSKLFSLQEYYALSEFTAVALLDANHADQAIDLIQHIPSAAFKFYNFSFRSTDPIFRSTRELLSLAYLVQGDYPQAEREATQLIADLQVQPVPCYLARAYTAAALAYCLQGKLDESVCFQENAVKLLQHTHDKSLYAVALFNLYTLYHISNKSKQATEAMQTLHSYLETLHDPRMLKLKSFLSAQINTENNAPSSSSRP